MSIITNLPNYEILKDIDKFYKNIYEKNLKTLYDTIKKKISPNSYIGANTSFTKKYNKQFESHKNHIAETYVTPLLYILYSYVYEKFYNRNLIYVMKNENALNYDLYKAMFSHYNPVIKKINVFFYENFKKSIVENSKVTPNNDVLQKIIDNKEKINTFIKKLNEQLGLEIKGNDERIDDYEKGKNLLKEYKVDYNDFKMNYEKIITIINNYDSKSTVKNNKINDEYILFGNFLYKIEKKTVTYNDVIEFKSKIISSVNSDINKLKDLLEKKNNPWDEFNGISKDLSKQSDDLEKIYTNIGKIIGKYTALSPASFDLNNFNQIKNENIDALNSINCEALNDEKTRLINTLNSSNPTNQTEFDNFVISIVNNQLAQFNNIINSTQSDINRIIDNNFKSRSGYSRSLSKINFITEYQEFFQKRSESDFNSEQRTLNRKNNEILNLLNRNKFLNKDLYEKIKTYKIPEYKFIKEDRENIEKNINSYDFTEIEKILNTKIKEKRNGRKKENSSKKSSKIEGADNLTSISDLKLILDKYSIFKVPEIKFINYFEEYDKLQSIYNKILDINYNLKLYLTNDEYKKIDKFDQIDNTIADLDTKI